MTQLKQLKDVLQWHATKKRVTLDEWFTLQLHERVLGSRLRKPMAGWATVQLEDGKVRVIDEQWPLERLQRFFRKWHMKDKPERTDQALAVFRGWGYEHLIDGQTRVNLWCGTGNLGPHRVLVVEPLLHIADPFPRKR